MMDDKSCPDPNQVAQLLVSDLPESELDEIYAHVPTCHACTNILRNLSKATTLLDSVLPHSNSSTVDPEDRLAIEQLIARVQTLPFTMSKFTGGTRIQPGDSFAARIDELATSLLHPPTSPGELGWLGSYRVLRVLGWGGMGVVFEAEDTRLGRRVAIKAMQSSLLASEEHKLRFEREARAVASIDHDNIVPIHQVGENRGVPFFVMPLLKGESLECRLLRDGKMSVAEAICIGEQISVGIAAAHDNGIFHRDIKPANIWLEQRGGQFPRVKILDFGLARYFDDDLHLTKTGSVAGTPAFMAPEQARGECGDALSDLFSIGCVLYYQLAGKPPFSGRNAASMLFATLNHQPESLSDIQPDVPDALSDLVTQLLQKDPARRVRKASDIAIALQTIRDQSTRQIPIIENRSHLHSPTVKWAVTSMLFAVVATCAVAWILKVVPQQGVVRDLPKIVSRDVATELAASVSQSSLKATQPADFFPGLVPNPTPVAGLRKWQIDTLSPRGEIFAVAWERDGRRVACGSPIGNVRIIDVATSKTVTIFPAHKGSVWAMDWSPTEDRIVTAGDDGAVRLFNARGEFQCELGSHEGIARSVAFNSDGTWIASGGFDSKVRLWRTTGEPGPILVGHHSQIDGVAWHPSGQKLASASLDGTVRIWNFNGAWNTFGIRGQELKGHLGGVLGLSWSPDGELLSSAGMDGNVLNWTDEGTRQSALSGHSAAVTAINWNIDRLMATSGDDKTIRVWQRDGTLLASQKLEVGRINDLEWSRDGSRLAVATDRGIRFLGNSGEWDGAIPVDTVSLRAIAFNPVGGFAAAGGAGFIGVWSDGGRLLRRLEGHRQTVYSVSWKAGGSQLFSGSWESPVRVWDADGNTLATRVGTHPTASSPTANEIAWASGADIYVAGTDPPERVLRGHQSQVIQIKWNSSGTQLASADKDGAIRVWNRDGSSVGAIQTEPMVSALAWHPLKSLLASGCEGDGNIRIWTLDGHLVCKWNAHMKSITALDYSPDGERLLSSSLDQRVRFWNEEGIALGELPGPMSIAFATNWSATDGQLATAHIDGAICEWDKTTLEPKSTCIVFNDGNWARFAPNGIAMSSDTAMLDHRFVVITQDEWGQNALMSVSQFRERMVSPSD